MLIFLIKDFSKIDPGVPANRFSARLRGARYQLTWEAPWCSDHVLIWTMMGAWNHLCSMSQEEGWRSWRAGTSGPECDFSALPTDALTPQCSHSVQKVWLHSCLHRQHQTDCSHPSGSMCPHTVINHSWALKIHQASPLVAHHQILPFFHSVVILQHKERLERFWDIMAHGDIWWQGCLQFNKTQCWQTNSDMYLRRSI